MADEQQYILGTDSTELERLGFQHRVWSQDAAALWSRANIQQGMKVLDLGAGPGFATFDLAEIVGETGSVTAIDISKSYVEYGNNQSKIRGFKNVNFLERQVHNLQLDYEEYDIIYCRWVLSWVEDVDSVIAESCRLLKPGGALLVQEYAQWGTFRIIPETPSIRTVIEACRESWRLMPSEIDIAPRLPEMFINGGLTIEHKGVLEKVSAPGQLVWQWPATFLHIYAEKLIEMGLLTEIKSTEFKNTWPILEANPSAMIVTPLMMEFIARKA